MGPIAAYIEGRNTAPTHNRAERMRSPVEVLGEKVYQATMAGRAGFMPFLDRYTHETQTMVLAYREMLKSPVVKAALLGKIYAVACLDLQMVPASDDPRDQEIADFVQYAYQTAVVGGIPKIAETILLHGLIDKHSISEKVWHDDVWPRGRWAGKRVYRDLKAKDHCQILQDQFRNVIGVRSVQFGQMEVFDPHDFVIFKNLALFEGPGMSDFRGVYASYWMLDTCQRLRMIHLEKFTSPYFKGTYQNIEDKPELETELELAKSRNWIVIPQEVQVEAMTIATRGEAEFAEAVRDFKEDIALAIAGAYLQMLTSHGGGAGGSGMRGNSKTQKSTAELFVWALSAKLSSIIDTQMTPDLVKMNYAGADYPTCTLGGINDQEMKVSAELDEILQRMGFPLGKKAMGKKYARSQAETPEDLLVPTPSAAPGMPGTAPGMAPPVAPPLLPLLPAAAAPTPPATPKPAPTKVFSEPERVADSVTDRVKALTEKYGADTARAVIQATAALLGGDKPHTFSEPVKPSAGRETILETALDYTQRRRNAAERATSHMKHTTETALADILSAIKSQPPPVVNLPEPKLPPTMKTTILYDDDGRVTGKIETPIMGE